MLQAKHNGNGVQIKTSGGHLRLMKNPQLVADFVNNVTATVSKLYRMLNMQYWQQRQSVCVMLLYQQMNILICNTNMQRQNMPVVLP
jgi:hypothetical protein